MLKIDPAVFNLLDPRVQALQSGKITVNAFSFTIQPYDYMALVGDTIYALSQAQYYAIQPIQPAVQFTKQQFQAILKEDFSALSQADQRLIAFINKAKQNCSSCKYKAYKSQLRRILLKYPQYRQRFGQTAQTHLNSFAKYPDTKGLIPELLSQKHPHLFERINYDRTPCFDCVQKHIGMAYVKGTEVQTGYPQHFMLCLANLQQAFQQCPVECSELRETLLFCVGKSKKEGKPFIPINILCGLVNVFRQRSNSSVALTQNKPAPDMALQLSDKMIQAISAIPLPEKVRITRVIAQINKLISKQNIDTTAQLRVQWAGRMVQLADYLLPYSEQLSNVVRNRRLIFKAAPSLSKDTEYSCQDIQTALRKN